MNIDEVLEYCQKHNCPFLETSAKTGLNVNESFRLLLDRIAEINPIKFKNSILCPVSDSNAEQKKKCTIS